MRRQRRQTCQKPERSHVSAAKWVLNWRIFAWFKVEFSSKMVKTNLTLNINETTRHFLPNLCETPAILRLLRSFLILLFYLFTCSSKCFSSLIFIRFFSRDHLKASFGGSSVRLRLAASVFLHSFFFCESFVKSLFLIADNVLLDFLLTAWLIITVGIHWPKLRPPPEQDRV